MLQRFLSYQYLFLLFYNFYVLLYIHNIKQPVRAFTILEKSEKITTESGELKYKML